jgi:uncharacterized protein (DUF488 family)
MRGKEIWTIGHSTHSIHDFLDLLKAHEIDLLADIRRFPGSRRYPQFNSDALASTLAENKIAYRHFEGLGGRRNPKPDSKNDSWRVAAFRGYADYMESEEFKKQIEILQALALQQRVVYMCSEAVWWSCHRALVSDYLKSIGWTVLHIMSKVKAEEHPWTKPARLVNGKLSYASHDSLFGQEKLSR